MRIKGFSEEHVPLHTYDSSNHRDENTNEFYVVADLEFDRALGTKKMCIAGLVFSIIVGAGFIGTGSLFKGFDGIYTLSPVALELIPLGINFVMLIITECLGFIHATCLRWALFREGRLEFNANLRLLTFSKRNLANGFVANVLYFITLAICYSGASLILVRNTYEFYLKGLYSEQDWNGIKNNVSLTKVVPTTLGTAILIQCLLSIWCLMTAQIPTWSSNPFTTLKAATHSGLVRRPGRCMMPVHDKDKPTSPTQPRARQFAPYGISGQITTALVVSGVVFVALIVWTAVIIPLGHKNDPGANWDFIPQAATQQSADFTSNTTMTVFLSFFTSNAKNPSNPAYIQEPTMAGVIAFCVAIQSFLTIGLHCAELQVTLQRDEALWRSIESDDGSPLGTKYNSIAQPLRSIPNVVLLILKPVIHWLFGSSIQVDYAQGVLMRVPQVTYLTVAWAIVLVFVTVVTFYKPKGYLPATYGHLQTMLDIADDLGPEPMYWKDKGEIDLHQGVPGIEWSNVIGGSYSQVRHAGTSGRRMEDERVMHGVYYS